MLSAGSKAPAVSLPDLNGSPNSLVEILSRGPVLLVFYKISCPTCQFTLPFLERIAKGSLPIVAISQDDAAGTRRFQSKFGTLPTLVDGEDQGYPASNAFGIEYVPSLFLVEPDGTISLTSEGFVKADLEAIASRASLPIFRATESVPAWKAG
ncbi:MAG TPA: TlpA disulfide reductase family protein [Bryobacteraceae bacterium]|jgi:peroxiredoxin|nr:TlpA disulfide reductase family protein [Bryobacteraceae bacterium]